MEQTDVVGELDETVADVAEDCDEAQEDDNNEADQLAELVDLIDARRAQGEFPLLQPRELLYDSEVSDAQDTLRLVRKIETVQIQSYLDHCRQIFFSNPLATRSDEPLKVQEARWSRDFTYKHMREFFCQKFVEEDVLSHRFDTGTFIPIISPKCDEDKDALSKLTENHMPAFNAALRKKWVFMPRSTLTKEENCRLLSL